MLEKPNLADDAILDGLRAAWGWPAAGLEFLPVGNDSSAWAYRLRGAAGEAAFLKLRRLPLDEATLELAHYLAAHGLPEAAAPLPARDGRLWAELGGYGLIVYPFVEGTNGMTSGLTLAQWRAFGDVLRRLHAADLPAGLLRRMAREDFRPRWAAMVRRVAARVEQGGFANQYQAEAAAFWRARAVEIAALTARCEELGAALRSAPPPYVACHADIHTANLLLEAHGGLRVVDWDQALLAPRERDLMFTLASPAGGGERSPQEAAFAAGYGAAAVDALTLTYYRYEWCVQELGDFGERLFFLAELGAETLADSLAGLRGLFAPGDVIAAAYREARA